MLQYLFLVIGFVLLVKGADIFVEGASSVAKLLKVPTIIIGLTIVAFGTSAPECAVSIAAAINGNNGIAVGNIVGSNILNLLVVLGVCAVILPMAIDKNILNGDYLFSLIISIVFLGMIGVDKRLGRIDGIILIILFVYFLYKTIKAAIKYKKIEDEENKEIKVMKPLVSIFYIIIGLVAIIYGGNTVVSSASAIALQFGLSEGLIGLTIVAIGTSLPELVTSVVASKKGENGLALGNIVGSNIFNILWIGGISSVIMPIKIDVSSLYDMIFFIVSLVLVWIFTRKDYKIQRKEGAVMLLLYIGYMIYIIMR